MTREDEENGVRPAGKNFQTPASSGQSRPRKLMLKCGLSPGDIVMLTAAVRDLHRCYPQQFSTAVQTLCPDLWDHNPYISRVSPGDGEVETIDCHYPLINESNEKPHHCLQGFIEFLNEKLGLRIKLSTVKGDIHLAAQEKAWHSQVYELTGEDTPFWIITTGGKYDATVKWWSPERYQQVVDHFRNKILFVQVGKRGHHHPGLEGVLDLRGKTTLRELVRLVHHADGVLSPVTCLMHLAAAVEWKRHPGGLRPCVVVAGGREPVHWEQYPGHQFIHRIGALKCCANGGCWRDRVNPLGDGDPRDGSDRLCLDVVNNLPLCLDSISHLEVIQRIETYYKGGVLNYLETSQWKAAERGIAATRSSNFDRSPLTTANVRVECERTIRQLPDYPDNFEGRGIVIAGGGCRYFVGTWVAIHLLRNTGCKLPIEVWHLGSQELDRGMAQLLEPLNVRCVDALEKRKAVPCRTLNGWELKCYAVMNSPFEEVLFLDADNVPVVDPEYLFDEPSYQETGAVFWPDIGFFEKTRAAWEMLGLECPSEPEFESGQMLINKRLCWKALCLAMWLNEHSDFFYQYLHGDKETFHVAFAKLKKPFAFIKSRVEALPGTMCQHDFSGRRIFQHRNTDKWNLFGNNPRVPGFLREDECRQSIELLQRKWTGHMQHGKYFAAPPSDVPPPTLACGMISCRARDTMRKQTLHRLRASDLGDVPFVLEMDEHDAPDPQERQTRTALRLMQRFLVERGEDYLLFLEDDLDFNLSLRANLEAWLPLRWRKVKVASLFNPGLIEEACDLRHQAYLVRPGRMFGSQALVLSRPAIRFFVDRWHEVSGMQDIRIARLTGRLNQPVWYHSPSLVQHAGSVSTWGGQYFVASDFDPKWKAGSAPRRINNSENNLSVSVP